MSLKKIVSIKGVARFEDLTAEKDVDFKKLTLIYGDNGTGKTTLAAILRSLGTGQPSYVAERATLGGAVASEIKVLLDAGLATFSASGTWDRTADIEVFDSDFVNDNVHAGDQVESDHRKNLYELVLGITGVALARRVDEINTTNRTLKSTINALEAQLRSQYQGPFELDDFLNLAPVEEVQARIDEGTSSLNACRRANEIVAREQPSPLPVPEIPHELIVVLQTGIEDVSTTAVAAVAAHIANRLDGDGERWLRQGLNYAADATTCPLCQQVLLDHAAIDTYREFFSAAYRKHALRVQQALDEVEIALGDEILMRLQQVLLENRSIQDTWKDLANLDYVDVDPHPFNAAWGRARTLLRAALREKVKNPGEVPRELDELMAAMSGLQREAEALTAHNKEIARGNSEIATLKTTLAASDPAALEDSLRLFRNAQIRQQVDTATLCAEYMSAVGQRSALEEEKKKVRATLEAEAKTLLGQHELEINALLASFGAKFRIVETKPSFAGGSASSTYRLSINDQMLDLSASRGNPSFRTALSAGDKSALGLAFFLANIRRDSNLASRVIVFDDPLSSLDQFRRSFTQQEIVRLANAAKQVVVLSHDPFFLKELRDSAGDVADTKQLYLARKPGGFTIRCWNIDDYCLHQNHKDYFLLQRFLKDGAAPGTDLVLIARAIRPYVEGALRFLFPTEFVGEVMLGKMISRIREATTQPLIGLQANLNVLEDINTYSKPFHHGGAIPVPNEAELQTKVEQALAYVQAP